MNARPYIFGCLCLVGATGTAAASDIDLTNLLSLGGMVASSSSSFEGSAAPSAPQAPGRDPSGTADSVHVRRSSAATASRPTAPTAPPTSTDIEDGPHDGPSPVRSTVPSWQSLLPGSML